MKNPSDQTTANAIASLKQMLRPEQIEALKKFRDDLHKLSEKHAGLVAEMEQFNKAEPELREQAQRIVSQLSEIIEPAKLVLLDPNSPELDPETQFAVKTLSGLRMKLELLPGVRNRIQKKITDLRAEASAELRTVERKLVHAGRDLLAVQEAKLREQLSPIMGGDPLRLKLSVEAVMEHCEVKRWYDFFNSYASSYFTLEGVPRLREIIAKFETGKDCVVQ